VLVSGGQSRQLRAYLVAVNLAGVGVLVAVLPRLDLEALSARSWLLVALVLVTELRPVRLPRERGETVEITVSPPFLFTLLLLEGVPLALAAAIVASLLVDVVRRKPLRKTAFNVAQYALQVAAAGAVISALLPRLPVASMDGSTLGVLALAALAFTAVNIGLVAGAVTLDVGVGLASILRPMAAATFSSLTLLGLAPIVMIVALHGGALVALFLVPAIAVHHSAQLVAERRHATLHDPVTGLVNHAALQDRGAQLLQSSAESNEPAVLLLADLERFRELNNNFGHPTGDRLLRNVAERIRQVMPDDALCARVGGGRVRGPAQRRLRRRWTRVGTTTTPLSGGTVHHHGTDPAGRGERRRRGPVAGQQRHHHGPGAARRRGPVRGEGAAQRGRAVQPDGGA
jgi:GGDEF domain-containing protein